MTIFILLIHLYAEDGVFHKLLIVTTGDVVIFQRWDWFGDEKRTGMIGAGVGAWVKTTTSDDKAKLLFRMT